MGAVLAHCMPDGSERPIAHASRSLSPTQCNYSQIERVALPCVFGVKKFYALLSGHAFELISWHYLTSIGRPQRKHLLVFVDGHSYS